jgi:hypothetical protein
LEATLTSRENRWENLATHGAGTFSHFR